LSFSEYLVLIYLIIGSRKIFFATNLILHKKWIKVCFTQFVR
jgi:hypothetical protein